MFPNAVMPAWKPSCWCWSCQYCQRCRVIFNKRIFITSLTCCCLQCLSPLQRLCCPWLWRLLRLFEWTNQLHSRWASLLGNFSCPIFFLFLCLNYYFCLCIMRFPVNKNLTKANSSINSNKLKQNLKLPLNSFVF